MLGYTEDELNAILENDRKYVNLLAEKRSGKIRSIREEDQRQR